MRASSIASTVTNPRAGQVPRLNLKSVNRPEVPAVCTSPRSPFHPAQLKSPRVQLASPRPSNPTPDTLSTEQDKTTLFVALGLQKPADGKETQPPRVGPSTYKPFDAIGVRRYSTQAGKPPGTGDEPAETASSQRAMVNRIHDFCQDEGTHWSTKYNSDPVFRNQIDTLVEARKALFDKMASGTLKPDEVIRQAERVAKLVAIAFGFSDGKTWTAQTLAGFTQGGKDYARPSQQANWLMQTPGIVRSLVHNLAKLAEHTGADPGVVDTLGKAASVATALYFLIQPLAMLMAPTANANAQSAAVAHQTHALLGWLLSFNSSKVVNEDGTAGTLRPPETVASERKALADLRDWVGSSDKLMEWELDELLRKLDGAMESQPNPELKAKWKGAIEALENRQWTEECDQLLNSLTHELAVSELYVRINVQTHQGNSRAIRSFLNLSASFLSMMAIKGKIERRESPDTTDGPDPVVLEVAALLVQIMQPVVYQALHGAAVGKDSLNKFADQLAITVLTGVSNFAPGGKVEPARLDKLVKGAAQVRLDHFGAALEFDRGVYTNAMAAYLFRGVARDPQGKPQRVTVHLPPEITEQGATGQARTVTMPCTVEALKKALAKTSSDKERSALLRGLASALSVPIDDRGRVLQIALQYGANERSIQLIKKKNVVQLLDPEHSPLPVDSRMQLMRALNFAIHRDPADAEADRWLAKTKGDVERYTKGSVHQNAQKIGMALANVICGSAGPNGAKYFANLSGLMSEAVLQACDHDPVQVSNIADKIKLVGLGIGEIGALLAIGLGYNAHRNIALKNQHRQRDDKAGMADIPYTGLVGRSDRAFTAWPNTARWKSQVDTFDTLAAEPISRPNLEAIPALKVDLTTDLVRDVKEQMFAVPLADIVTSIFKKHGNLNEANEETIRQAMQQELRELKLMLAAKAASAAAEPTLPTPRDTDDDSPRRD